MLRRAIQHRIIPFSDSINITRRFLTKGVQSCRGHHLGGLSLKISGSWTRLTPSTFRRGFASSSESKPEEIQNGTDQFPLEEPSGEVEYTLQLTDEEIQEISGGDPEIVKKIKYIQLEHEVYRQEGLKVPLKMKMKNWKELLDLSRNGRRKFYNFLWLNEIKGEKDKIKKQQEREERYKGSPELPPRVEDPNGVAYGLSRNTLFLRLYDTTINKYYHNKLATCMMFSRPLVLDCGYDEFMTPREAKNCAKQIEMTITDNKQHHQPFNIYLCNANPNSKIMDYLQRIIPTIYEDTYPLNITEKSYLDVFPHKELVYLSPHARDVLEKYDEDEVYIIGAMVDKSDPRPFSLAKAKKENVRMKKLPLDNHLMWGLGTKSLTVNQMGNIMLDMRYTQDWTEALKHVPRRKLQREYHPYPEDDPRTQQFQQTNRRESKSQVLEDFELMNQRKGYRNNRQSDSNYSNTNFGFNRPKKFSNENNNNNRQQQDNRYSNRSIRYDEE